VTKRVGEDDSRWELQIGLIETRKDFRDSGRLLTGGEEAYQLGGCLVSLVHEGELKGSANLILPGHIRQVCREKLN
jgi:hypothetical protein